MDSEITEALLEKLPQKRRVAITTSYSKAPAFIIKALNECMTKLNYVRDTYDYIKDADGNYILDRYGRRIPEGCHYNEQKMCIAMSDSMTNDEYTDVLHHELGHFVDHAMGTISSNCDFQAAFEQTVQQLNLATPQGRAFLRDILDDAFSTGAAYDLNVTDIISALTMNDSSVVREFYEENVAYYRHENHYWGATTYDGTSLRKREKEIFANIFAIETDNYRISRNFIERWFPQLVDSFVMSIQR